MNAMNGVTLGTKQLVVRLHEPKQLRQEKLAQRFGGHNGHPRSSSGATSPTASEAGESYAGWPSPSSHPAVLGSPVMGHHERPDNRARRSSGSFYHVGACFMCSYFIGLTSRAGRACGYAQPAHAL